LSDGKFGSLTEMVHLARASLSRDSWDYLMGAADTETTLKRNRLSIDSLQFRPRVLHDVREVSIATELIGQPLRMPVILPPIGSVQLFEKGGGASVAQGAESFGTMQILSSVCTPDYEAVANASAAAKVYQLYLMGDQGWMDDVIARSIELGYVGFCLTADTQVYSRRERDILKRWRPPSGTSVVESDFSYQASMNWDTIAHIKEKFDIPLLVKGINRTDDAARAVDAGVDVVYVSNHGGRQLDHGRGCIDSLPEVVAAVDGRAPVVVDGGFLRGSDVVKALCRGATAVGMGRLEGLAMAAGGAAGIVRALELVEHEIKTTMALMGAANLGELNPDFLERSEATVAPHVLSAFPLLEDGYL